jgi:hypothetical protein
MKRLNHNLTYELDEDCDGIIYHGSTHLGYVSQKVWARVLAGPRRGRPSLTRRAETERSYGIHRMGL